MRKICYMMYLHVFAPSQQLYPIKSSGEGHQQRILCLQDTDQSINQQHILHECHPYCFELDEVPALQLGQ